MGTHDQNDAQYFKAMADKLNKFFGVKRSKQILKWSDF